RVRLGAAPLTVPAPGVQGGGSAWRVAGPPDCPRARRPGRRQRVARCRTPGLSPRQASRAAAARGALPDPLTVPAPGVLGGGSAWRVAGPPDCPRARRPARHRAWRVAGPLTVRAAFGFRVRRDPAARVPPGDSADRPRVTPY